MKLIVVIDDNVDILEMLTAVLEFKQYQVETHQSSASFHQMHNRLPDLILLDIFLQQEDGRSVCRQLKTHEFTKHIPVILFSGSCVARHALRDSLADDFLTKPFHLDQLFRLVQKHLNASATRGEEEENR